MKERSVKEIDFIDVGGFSLGHEHDEVGITGCTVILPDECAVAGVDIRGGGPASREVHLLHPLAAAMGIHGVLLSGGSAFGLDAAGGVMKYLEEQDIGFDVGVAKVPLVCQSCIFDLHIGNGKIRPDAKMAYRACQNAKKNERRQGSVGVGIGCTVGKVKGPQYAMQGGIGTFALQLGKIKVGALVAVNAFGDVYDRAKNKQIAGALNDAKDGMESSREVLYKMAEENAFTGNTTLGVIVTNCTFTKAQMCKIASMAQNGLVRAIDPIHTTMDGDTVYAVSTGNEIANIDIVGTLAAEVMERAIIRSINEHTLVIY